MRSRRSSQASRESSWSSTSNNSDQIISTSSSPSSSTSSSPSSNKRTNFLKMSSPSSPSSPKLVLAWIIASIYVLSGSTQPLLMTLVKRSGLGDPTCQVYMLFYYIGPALVSLSLCCQPSSQASTTTSSTTSSTTSITLILKACSIAVIDIIAQSLNYTGSIMAGPTIFAIIYSSVTVWTAVYSYILLSRKLNIQQWSGVIIVFLGLFITSINSVSVGEHVFHGTVLILIGSSLHALTYVLSEIIMTKNKLPIVLNCSVQAMVAVSFYLCWQIVYTRKRYHERIEVPMMESHTTYKDGLLILSSLSLSNLVHATSFFYTLKYFPGGSTSAGVMKGLQAVLVFLFSSLVYCKSSGSDGIDGSDNHGGQEMCFTMEKFISLVVVLSGIMLFGIATDGNNGNSSAGSGDETGNGSGRHDDNNILPSNSRKKGYYQINSIDEENDDDIITTHAIA